MSFHLEKRLHLLSRIIIYTYYISKKQKQKSYYISRNKKYIFLLIVPVEGFYIRVQNIMSGKFLITYRLTSKTLAQHSNHN